MRVSVVIHARERSQDLERTLHALRYQTHPSFEVVVVLGGPWAFEADPVPAPFATAVKVARDIQGHLACCRNRGLALTSGDVVAFLDAGSVPDPHWLEELLAGYDTDLVAGVGGATCSVSGRPLGPDRPVCDRGGTPHEEPRPPRWGYLLPRGVQFVHLLGTDASFLRRRLEEVGGFDEEIDSYLADSDVCVRLIDRGYLLKRVGRALVYHAELAPHLAGDDGILSRPRAAARERTYFTLRSALPLTTTLEALDQSNRFIDHLVQQARTSQGGEGLAAYADEVERGLWLGISRALIGPRKIPPVAPAAAQGFRPFPILRPLPQALTVCLVALGECDSMEGLAQGLAGRGHEVHLLVGTEGPEQIVFEDGVWVHRLSPPGVEGEASDPVGVSITARDHLAWAAAAHGAVRRLSRSRFVDLVGVPLWGGVGARCLLDDELTCVLCLTAPGRSHAPLARAVADSGVRALERLCLRSARFIHSLGAGPLEEARLEYGELQEGAGVMVTSAGSDDRAVEEAVRAYAAVVERRKAA
ncbi:MAG: glycosyltransferase [Gemmataceae bacterium]|nr:glycosyltransferase [Gemmataceae bacterium]